MVDAPSILKTLNMWLNMNIKINMAKVKLNRDQNWKKSNILKLQV